MPAMLYDLQLDTPFLTYDETRRNYSYSTNVFNYVEEPEEAPACRTYGVEIELNSVRRRRAHFTRGVLQVFEKAPCFIVKSDSTIDEQGGEIVTVPLSLDAAKPLFEAVQEFATGAYGVNDATGVHIHAAVPNNIWALARMHLMVMCYTSKQFVTFVAGREPGVFHGRGSDVIRSTDAVEWARGRQRGNHRTALEFSSKGTLEFRSFAGTTSASQLMSYMEFYDALIEFTTKRVQGVALADFNVLDEFRAFVLDNTARWPALAAKLGTPECDHVLNSCRPYGNSAKGLFLPREMRVRGPVEIPDLETPTQDLAALFSNPAYEVASPRVTTGPMSFATLVNTRLRNVADPARTRIIGTTDGGVAVSYGWLIDRFFDISPSAWTANVSADQSVTFSRTGMYAALNVIFGRWFVSARGTEYTGRRLYTLMLNYHLPRAFALANITANASTYGRTYAFTVGPDAPAPALTLGREAMVGLTMYLRTTSGRPPRARTLTTARNHIRRNAQNLTLAQSVALNALSDEATRAFIEAIANAVALDSTTPTIAVALPSGAHA